METHRVKIDTGHDKERGQFTLALWRASAVALELGLFEAGAVLDLADLSSITLRIRKARMATEVLLEQAVDNADFSSCTAEQWTAGTHEHVRIELGSEAMNITTGVKKATLHVTVSAITDGGDARVLAMGEIVLVDANAVPGEVTPSGGGTLLTLEEADARYLRDTGEQELTEEQQLQVLENLGITFTASTVTFPNGRTVYLNAEA